MKNWECTVCGHIYSEEKGSSRDKIPTNTPFEDLPEDWVCPVCQVGKDEFVEI